MNETQSNRERFPGIKFKDDFGVEYLDIKTYRLRSSRLRSRIFSAHQSESKVLECMQDIVFDMVGCRCSCVVLKYSEYWYDHSKYFNKNSAIYFNKDSAIGRLFEDSLGWYITKFVIERKDNDDFTLWIKLKELGGLETNIGPNLLEYIASLF